MNENKNDRSLMAGLWITGWLFTFGYYLPELVADTHALTLPVFLIFSFAGWPVALGIALSRWL